MNAFELGYAIGGMYKEARKKRRVHISRMSSLPKETPQGQTHVQPDFSIAGATTAGAGGGNGGGSGAGGGSGGGGGGGGSM